MAGWLPYMENKVLRMSLGTILCTQRKPDFFKMTCFTRQAVPRSCIAHPLFHTFTLQTACAALHHGVPSEVYNIFSQDWVSEMKGDSNEK